MELQDCAFPLVHDVSASSDLAEGFRGEDLGQIHVGLHGVPPFEWQASVLIVL